jgi:hypothetical protein
MLAVVVGWVLFRATSPAEAFGMIAAMAGLRQGEGGHLALVSPEAAGTLVLAGVIIYGAPNTWQLRFPRTRLAAVLLAALLVLCALRFAAPSPFLYFQF